MPEKDVIERARRDAEETKASSATNVTTMALAQVRSSGPETFTFNGKDVREEVLCYSL